MATTILKYDARNTLAKKTLNYILSLGVFEMVENTCLEKSATHELTPKQKKLIAILKKVKKNAETGNYKTQSVKSFFNEL